MKRALILSLLLAAGFGLQAQSTTVLLTLGGSAPTTCQTTDIWYDGTKFNVPAANSSSTACTWVPMTSGQSITIGAGTGIVLGGTATAPTISIDPKFTASIDQVHAGLDVCTSTTGSTAYTCSMPGKPLVSLTVGTHLYLLADTTCTGACTLNVDGTGAKSLKRPDGATDPTGIPVAKVPRLLWYNGTVWLVLN